MTAAWRPAALPAPGGDPLLQVRGLRIVSRIQGVRARYHGRVGLRPRAGRDARHRRRVRQRQVDDGPGADRPAAGRRAADGRGHATAASERAGAARARAAGGCAAPSSRMVFQDPFTMLNPLMRCGDQIVELIPTTAAGRCAARPRRAEAVRRLAEVGITDPAVADAYPFELSGGMRQRVGIAAALARDPQLLIADEPSTALDVTTQRQILARLRDVQQGRGMGLILITHDLRVAFALCDRVHGAVRRARCWRPRAADQLEAEPLHPYTLGLLLSEPPVDRRLSQMARHPRLGARARPGRGNRARSRPVRAGGSTRARPRAPPLARGGRRAMVGVLRVARDRAGHAGGRGPSARGRAATPAGGQPGGSRASRGRRHRPRRDEGVRRAASAPGSRVPALKGVEPRDRRGRGRRAGRRVGLGQDDAGPLPGRARAADRAGPSSSTAPTPRTLAGLSRRRAAAAAAQPCRWSSRTRTRRSTRPARSGPRWREAIAAATSRPATSAPARGRAAGARRAAGPVRRAQAGRAVRRRAPAGGHRARPGRPAAADHLRRAGLGARRVGAGSDPEPADATCAAS